MVRRIGSFVFVACALVAAPLRAQSRVDELLAGCTRDTVVIVGERLAALGTGGVDELVARFVADARGGTPDPAQRAALIYALEPQRRAALAALRRGAGDEPDGATRCAALELHAEIGGAGDFARAFEYAVVPAGDPARSACATALRACVARLVARERIDTPDLLVTLTTAETESRFAVVRGLGDARTARSFTLLAALLGRGAVSDPTVLAEIGRVARAGAAPGEPRVLDDVRRCLAAVDAATVREATLCAGALLDDDAADALVRLLESSDSAIATNAHWALRRLTGRDLGPRPEAWSTWLGAEREWWSQHSERALAELASPAPERRAAALHALAEHRFPRRALSAAIAEALPLGHPDTLDGACRLLEELGSDGALAVLRRRLPSVARNTVRKRLESTLERLAR